jgi:hypothetical protein
MNGPTFHDRQQPATDEFTSREDLKFVTDDRTYRVFTVTREYCIDVALDEVAQMLADGVDIDEDEDVLEWLNDRNYVDECMVDEDGGWEGHITTPIPDGWLAVSDE